MRRGLFRTSVPALSIKVTVLTMTMMAMPMMMTMVQVRLAGLVPMDLQSWGKPALDMLHATLVDRRLAVQRVDRVEEEQGEQEEPMEAEVRIGDVDVARMLVSNGFARWRKDTE